jgi:hypothetical protein
MRIKPRLALLSVLIMACLAAQAWADGCYNFTDNVGAGCWNQSCDGGGTVFEPAQGYVRIHTYSCCYTNGTVSSATDYGCTDDHLGCCSLIASAPDCPNLTCPRNEPAQ